MKVRTLLAPAVLAAVATVGVMAPTASASGTKLTQSQAAAQFRAAGITWSSSGNCTTRSNPTCTSGWTGSTPAR